MKAAALLAAPHFFLCLSFTPADVTASHSSCEVKEAGDAVHSNAINSSFITVVFSCVPSF